MWASLLGAPASLLLDRRSLNNMKKIATLMCAIAAFGIVGFGVVGCGGGEDNAADVEKMKTPEASNNPDVPAPAKADMNMSDDPKSLKGKGPAAGGGPD